LWRLGPEPAPLWTIGQRSDDPELAPEEYPIAVSGGAARILTGAAHRRSCYLGPDFEVHVRDNGAGEVVVDALPPGVTAVDAAARTIAYGAQLWCAR
jgi:hypothetical protein